MYWTLKRILTWLLVLAFIGTIIFYAYYQSRGAIAGPQIILATPKGGENATTSLIHVTGVASRAKELTLDGRAIFVDLRGYFDEQLLLHDGYNIIELTAKDSGGHETKKTVEVILKSAETF